MECIKFFGVPQKLINLAKLTLSVINCRVRIGNNLVVEYAVRSSRIETNGTIFHKMSQILAYADDVDLIARNENQLQQNLEAFEEAARDVGLVIN